MCLDAISEITESAVIGVPHPDFGEAVVAICVSTSRPPPDSRKLLAATADQLAAFKRPKAILFTKELPRNAMGKVQKNQLRDMHKHLFMAE